MNRRLCSNCGIPLFANYQDVGWNHCDQEMNPFGNGCKFDGLFACAGKCLCPQNAEMIGEFEPEIRAEQPRPKFEKVFRFEVEVYQNLFPKTFVPPYEEPPVPLPPDPDEVELLGDISAAVGKFYPDHSISSRLAASPLPARTLSELMEQQGVKPIEDLSVLAGGIPEDVDVKTHEGENSNELEHKFYKACSED